MALVLNERKEYTYKMVVLGYYSVGKSSLIQKYVKDEFNPNEESTIGAAFLTKTSIYPNYNIKYEIWDTAGQERYNSLIPMYYRGAHVALIVYDITCPESFETAKNWVTELSSEKPKNFVKVLIGNKSDLENTSRKVGFDEAKEYARRNKMLFFEASAKTGFNVENVFSSVSEMLPKDLKEKKKNHVRIIEKKKLFFCC
ncbi:small GTP-binding protein domain [Vavraia culicis subsp. floridensis]|uniref:Small GTP-binding protein domain n=1 Tax=Vavraia culicis (isolate floridensis) TaxID=948595 RepID=L2GYJ3_VAVCU|nr:small GTP-binding protein domain [Vavraia culicis subsp. floridensis]ELA48397.1 small GTP-binding protein domain [Vavraia culicis subsp. floridensis]